METVAEFLALMRARLAPVGNTPEGEPPIVKLYLGNAGYVEHALVASAIDELERRMITHPALREPTNALERLAILLLTETNK